MKPQPQVSQSEATANKVSHIPGAIANEVRSYLNRIDKSNEADYAFRAINAHDELLEALKRIQEFFSFNTSVSPSALVNDLEGTEKTMREWVKEAIAKAEGR